MVQFSLDVQGIEVIAMKPLHSSMTARVKDLLMIVGGVWGVGREVGEALLGASWLRVVGTAELGTSGYFISARLSRF